MMAGMLIYSDKQNIALELLTAARLLKNATGLKINALTVNDDEQASALSGSGADVYKITDDGLSLADANVIAEIVKQAAEKAEADIIFLGSNRRGKELAGRLAQKMGAGCLTDVGGLAIEEGKIEYTRNSLGGATVARQQITTSRQVIALSPHAFEAAGTAAAGNILALDTTRPETAVKLAEIKNRNTGAVDIQNADILVIVGQGVEKEDLAHASAIAKALGGEVACSKPVATDKKWFPEDVIVGLSGKQCRPQLAIIFGVSGQVQFTVGIRDAHTIAAVNNDENAFIFQLADYSMVADSKEVLPGLAKALN
ncbi:MAG: electron transfer flavoprotein subunit alpha/FixB family protein [Syntrophomonadaceae bacterium]|jgi:electron transfer flavoprotein alpha subunit|nr:electron transfer flavoprotein subunit alpha/FixB family protein [Syntrophomonadaceae bacterium]